MDQWRQTWRRGIQAKTTTGATEDEWQSEFRHPAALRVKPGLSRSFVGTSQSRRLRSGNLHPASSDADIT